MACAAGVVVGDGVQSFLQLSVALPLHSFPLHGPPGEHRSQDPVVPPTTPTSDFHSPYPAVFSCVCDAGDELDSGRDVLFKVHETYTYDAAAASTTQPRTLAALTTASFQSSSTPSEPSPVWGYSMATSCTREHSSTHTPDRRRPRKTPPSSIKPSKRHAKRRTHCARDSTLRRFPSSSPSHNLYGRAPDLEDAQWWIEQVLDSIERRRSTKDTKAKENELQATGNSRERKWRHGNIGDDEDERDS